MRTGKRLNGNPRTSAMLALAACATLGFGWVSTASGAVIVAYDSNRDGPYTVANDDLLQTSAVLESASVRTGDGAVGLPEVLTDGVHGVGDSTHRVGAQSGHYVLYSLDTVASPAGYTLTNINIYGGWHDSGRDHQKLTVAYSTVTDPDTFTDLAAVDYNPPFTGGGLTYTAAWLSSDSGPLVDNVAKVRFSFQNAEATWSGYSELDVIGAPVPEPTTLAGLGLAMMGLAVRRRRN